MSDRGPFAGIAPNEIHARLVEMGAAWAEAQAAAQLLEEVAKPTLAALTLRFMDRGVARVLAETEALASDDYRRHVEKMVAARREANVARVRYNSAMTWADLLRTQAATRRAEMSLGGMAT